MEQTENRRGIRRCNDPTVAGVEECVGTFSDSTGIEVERVWSKPFYSFDSFVDAMLSLFVVATLDGYSPIMEDAISVPAAKGLQPQPHSTQVNALYFVAFIVVTVFVMLNLFVGALQIFQSLCVLPVNKVDCFPLDMGTSRDLSLQLHCRIEHDWLPVSNMEL